MVRWLPLLVLLLWPTAGWAQQAGARVLIDAPIVVTPWSPPTAGITPQCLEIGPGTLTVEVQRVGNAGGGAYPVALRMGSSPTYLLPDQPVYAVNDSPQTITYPLPEQVTYCYVLRHQEQWTTADTAGPQAQYIRLRMTLAP